MSTANIPISGVPVVLFPININGQRTGNVTAAARHKLPFACTVLGVSASARASGGVTPTLTVDALVAGASILSAPIAVTAGAVAEGIVATPAVADEALLTIDLAIGGTNPTWDDVSVTLTLARK